MEMFKMAKWMACPLPKPDKLYQAILLKSCKANDTLP
jgi:hypothetical protein